MNKQVEREILKIYKAVYKKVFTNSSYKMLSTGSKSTIISRILVLQSSKQYETFCKEFAKRVAKKGLNKEKGLWKLYFEAAKKAGRIAITKPYKEYETEMMKLAIEHNFKMIKSIPTWMSEMVYHKYTDVLIEEVANGSLPRGSFKKSLESHAIKNAKLIARTETAKLQTAIVENRCTNLGSVAYIWKSSNDVRTRPSHKEMNGVVVFWRKDQLKPMLDGMLGNAGEFPNCRCAPMAIFDEDDLKLNNYKVYDYLHHTIINVTKKQLIEMLKQNSITI